MKSKILIVFLILVLFSGCIDTLPVGGKYCSEIGLCKVEEKPVEIPDIITIEEVKVLPIVGNRVKPDAKLEIIVTLKNRDEDKPVTLTEVRINPGIFTCIDCEEKMLELNPGQIKTLTFIVTAPPNEGTLALPAHLEVSVEYKYTSSRLATITFIDRGTFVEYIEGGGKIDVSIINVPSDGPVELYLDISKIQQPVILDETTLNFYLEVRNKGSGEVEEIEKNALEITLENMEFVDCSEEFDGKECKEGEVTNKEPITIRGPTPKKYYFSIKPSIETLKDQLTVTKKITAKAEYTYRITHPIELLVSPRAEI